jgi:iron complex outermembrane receptor protein
VEKVEMSLRNQHRGKFSFKVGRRLPLWISLCVLGILTLETPSARAREAEEVPQIGVQAANVFLEGQATEAPLSPAPVAEPANSAVPPAIPQLHELEQPATSVADWTAQIAQSLVQVTGVRVEAQESSLQVILETPEGELAVPATRSIGNALIADIPNAVLALPEGNEFQQANPIAGIALVSVTRLPGDRVRVSMTGSDAPPTAEVNAAAQGLTFSVVLGATEQVSEPDEAIQVVVTATRTEEELENVPRSVTVITREEIEQQLTVSQSRNLQDILGNLVPGLAPSTQSSINSNQTLRGRGVQVLVDGVPLRSNLDNQPRDLRSLDPSQIERVEVIRGPSAVYGDGGTGGVINLITRQPEAGELLHSLSIGVNAAAGDGDSFLLGDSFGNDFAYTLSGNSGVVDFLFNLAYSNTGGFYDAEGNRIPQFGPDSDTETVGLLGKVGVDLNEEQRLQFSASYFDADVNLLVFSDPSIVEIPGIQFARAIENNFELDGNDLGNTTSILDLSYSHDNLFGNQVQAQVFYRNASLTDVPEDFRVFGFVDPAIYNGTIDRELFGGRLQIETPIVSRLNLLWGVDYLNEAVSQDLTVFDPQVFDRSGGRVFQTIGEVPYIPPYHFTNLGIFAQLQWEATDWLTVSAGARYERFGLSVDDYTALGFGIVPNRPVEGGNINFDDVLFNIGAIVNITNEISVFASFAQGFSAPSFGTILRDPPEGFTSVENDLEITSPQKVNNYEIGVRADWQSVQTSLALFYNDSELGVGFEESLTRSRVVRQPQRFWGLEGTLDWQPGGGWELGGTISLLEGEFENEAGDFLNIDGFTVAPPKYTAYVQHETDFGWQNRLQLLFVGDRNAAFEDGVDPVPVRGYTTLDFISSIPLLGGQLEFSVENLLNRQYAPFNNQVNAGYFEPGNIAARGRVVRLGYSIRW